MDFSGQTLVVTGGANGIGLAAARAYAKAGGQVAIVDRDLAAAEAVAAELAKGGARAIAIGADVTKAEDVAGYVRQATETFGGIDAFFNNAGIEGDVKPVVDYDDAMFDAVIGVNLRGVYLGLKHVLPVMIAKGRGAVVNTASVAGLTGSPMMPAYCASKHAVIGITKVVAGEVARQGVTVNCVCPGPVQTRMIDAIEGQINPDDPGRAKSNYQSGLPTGRYSTVEEIADAVMFLVSPGARHINGTQLVIDGGRTATGGASTVLAKR